MFVAYPMMDPYLNPRGSGNQSNSPTDYIPCGKCGVMIRRDQAWVFDGISYCSVCYFRASGFQTPKI